MAESQFLNRELSWLEFNHRVLEEALDENVPLLERLKFLAIFSVNLDEFFMIRVARLKWRVATGDGEAGPDGLTPAQTLAAISTRVHQLVAEQHQVFVNDLQARLTAEGVRVWTSLDSADLTAEQATFLDDYFQRVIFPVVTPLVIDPGHPFPYLANRLLCLVVAMRRIDQSNLPEATLSVVHLPAQVVPRFVALPAPPGQFHFVMLEDVIQHYLPQLYPAYEILSCHAVRVTRGADLQLAEENPKNLLASIERGVRKRRMGEAVRLQYDRTLPAGVLTQFVQELELQPDELYAEGGFAAFADLFQLYSAVDLPRLKDRPLPPHRVPAFDDARGVWGAIRTEDILVHHPYHSFDAVTQFVAAAASDPKVLAIKMTLYRVSPTSPVAAALTRAAEAGKEVAVLIELRARFDEEANIAWARSLQEVGAHVVYGIAGYKTHCKACLVVRQETDGIRRYCHLATGNYNARTSGIYSDLGLFTCREAIGEDVAHLFNLLTGYSQPPRFHHLLVAPINLRDGLVARIRREVEHARAGKAARLIVKVNSLVDPPLIEELYVASQAGVQIDLLVRGICCLRPGVPGLSERVRVISIIDRYLEHARIYYFHNAGESEYWLSSADWMPRNLDRRVEGAFLVLAPPLQALLQEILEVQLADTVKARLLLPDGSCRRLQGNASPVRSQEHLYSVTYAGRPAAG